MIQTAPTVPTPDEIADRLLGPTVDDTETTNRLTAQLGAQAARQLLAEAHGIAAVRLGLDAA
ncbi:hypothetical protein [[Kitasatospora] papulosa]|uniref:hypothetical protein n=1 Tax=[Kitasatospora] papulosa TaxID=1464011 RepID=UPI0036A3474B